MKKGKLALLFFGILFISLIIAAGVDKTKDWHDSTAVSIGIDGINQTIDAIMTINFAFPYHIYSSVLSLNPGHNFNQIWVSVKDGEMSLSAALNSTDKLCPASPLKNYTSSPADKSQPYHYATEIQLSSGKNLQEAINAGTLCCSTSLGNYCTPSGTSGYCINTQGTLACDGTTCIGTTFKAAGTGCHCITPKCICAFGDTTCINSGRCSTKCDTTQTCDSSGNCK